MKFIILIKAYAIAFMIAGNCSAIDPVPCSSPPVTQLDIDRVIDQIQHLDAKHDTRIDNLRAEINTRIDNINGRFDDINGRFDNISTRIDNLRAEINTRIDNINTRIDDINTRFDDRLAKFETKVENQIRDLRNEIQDLRIENWTIGGIIAVIISLFGFFQMRRQSESVPVRTQRTQPSPVQELSIPQQSAEVLAESPISAEATKPAK